MTLDQNNIIKILHHSLDVDFESKTSKNIINLIELSRNIESIKSRYKSVLESEKKVENNEETKLFFQARIEGYYELSRDELQEYCDFKNIDLKDINIWQYSINEKAREWKTATIRNEILNEIYGAEPCEFKNIVLIPKSGSKVFYRKFKNQNHIDWGSLSSEVNFDWTSEIIEDGKDLWQWEKLIANQGIEWNFTLIDKHKERLNWAYISSMDLKWNIFEISRFKDYLVFKGEYGSGLQSANGKWHRTDRFADYSKKHNVVGNISANEYIDWNSELILEFKDYWDWELLCKNRSTKWNQLNIKIFDKYFDYKSLSKNPDFNWDELFIIENKEKLCIHSLIENKSIVWTPKLIRNFLNEIDFTHLSKKGNLSKSAIIEWSQQWNKIDSQRHYGRRNSDGSYYYYTTHTLWEYLCENQNIIWTEDILTQFLEFLPLKNLCDKRIKVSTNFINDNWDFYKNELTYYWENYDGDATKTYQDVYLRDKIKNCKIPDLTLEKFVENEIRWWGVFCSEDFLNHTIKEIITAPNTRYKQFGDLA